MDDPQTSGFIPDDSVSASVTDTATLGGAGQAELVEPDRKFSVQRQLTFTLSYNIEGSAKPRLIRKFSKWLRK